VTVVFERHTAAHYQELVQLGRGVGPQHIRRVLDRDARAQMVGPRTDLSQRG
jgi:hypothetical protein